MRKGGKEGCLRCCGSDLKKKKVGTTPVLFLYISGELTDYLDSLLLNLFICFFFPTGKAGL